jgi:hypothetical protein
MRHDFSRHVKYVKIERGHKKTIFEAEVEDALQ